MSYDIDDEAVFAESRLHAAEIAVADQIDIIRRVKEMSADTAQHEEVLMTLQKELSDWMLFRNMFRIKSEMLKDSMKDVPKLGEQPTPDA
ncbi:hypothetical protein [Hansschlegelia zhihuaiae]|uniref:Uncharacterized protein n=1 Tax=Hansschlegelia zhihuaiae TaxID=405005 RepID=A0A4Q0M7X1_9HYPH|nr:hypothetical protein [Hansschlegelia zhihuaiae]RXF69218.1 hypothetical protein EK403_18705 [Hansschlegelia zhihuaiae]